MKKHLLPSVFHRIPRRPLKTAAAICIVSLLVGACFFFENSRPRVHASEDEEAAPLHIGICLDENTPFSAYVKAGFEDALSDALPDTSIVYAEQTIRDAASPATAAETLLQAGCSLIFAFGEESLEATAAVTDQIPIYFGGVTDYRSALHLLVNSLDSTGRNVSGLVGRSSPAAALSLLIEAADNRPKAVGILYDPSDTQTILQNEIFEELLDTAGIPWKEYEVSTPDEETPRDSSQNALLSAVPLPSIAAAASGKEGPNIHPDSIGDNGDLTGINEPMSAHSAKQSVLWKQKGKKHSGTFSQIAPIAASECDAIYLCAGNRLAEDAAQMELLSTSCIAAQTATVGGDENIGAHTLVCLYEDPYDLGYQCGINSVEIINEDEEISEMPVEFLSPSKSTKLFNAQISEAMQKTWPKSFQERASYLENYEPGSLTERIVD